VTIPNVGDFFSFRVYLQQINAAAAPTINQLGVQGTGVRLNYPGGIVRVPAATAINMAANPAYDLVQRGGTGTTTDTTTSAFLQDGLFDPNTPLPLPADTGDSLRMLIGTFRIQALAQGPVTIQAVDPFPAGINNLSGPDPAIPVAGGGFNSVGPGAHNIDPGLVPSSLIVTVGVPEPSTLALGGLAAAGLAVVRRRKATAAATAV